MAKGLRLKFGLIVLSLLLLWLGLTVYLSIYRARLIADSEVANDSAPVVGVLSIALTTEVETGDIAGVGSVLGRVMSENPNIAYVKVQDNSGSVIKETGEETGQDRFVARPITGQAGALGTVTVGFRKTSRTQEIKRNFSWFPVTAALALFSLLVLIISFNRLVLAPLGKMNKVLGEMAAGGGDLTQRLDIDSRDEIGDMAKNLNTFLSRLRELVSNAQASSVFLLELTRRIGEKSRNVIASAQEQSSATNENFQALERMHKALQDVAGSSESLSITASDSSATVAEMSAQVEVVADNTNDLSGHAEETSSSIAEMSGSINDVAENVKALSELTFRTTEAITKIHESIKVVESRSKESASISQEVSEDADILGNKAISRTIQGMELIKKTVEETSSIIETLGVRSKEIGGIVQVIDEITNQTSLLALNAAILAAQAGEHGKGFSVVASEIKDLAERTTSSTGEIARLIKSVQQESKAAVEAMRAGKDQVVDGMRLAYGAAEALSTIIDSSLRAREVSTMIEKATTQQVSAVRQLSDAINNVHERIRSIERSTAEQSKGGELIASASEKMSDIAGEVRRAMAEQTRGIKDFARSLDETKEIVNSVAGSTKSQSDDTLKLVRSMERFLEIAQNNSEISIEMEEAVEELQRQAEALKDGMERFKV